MIKCAEWFGCRGLSGIELIAGANSSPSALQIPVSGIAPAAAYASADVFLFPSQTETLGLVLLEAMASGCPVVAARVGGVPDLVLDGHSGLLFEPGEPAGAVRAVRRLLGHAELRAKLRLNGRRQAERWGWGAAAEDLRRHYVAVLAAAARGTAA